jgi:hypothetical protein
MACFVQLFAEIALRLAIAPVRDHWGLSRCQGSARPGAVICLASL